MSLTDIVKYTLASGFLVVALTGALCPKGRADEDENCEAPPGWFPTTQKPTYQKPDPDSDCEFYQWAWQTFLYVTQSEAGNASPRFLTYDTPDDVFPPAATPRFAKDPAKQDPVVRPAEKKVLRLAPRFSKLPGHSSLSSILQADSQGVIVDQNNRLLYYAQHMNPDFVRFIDAHNFRNVQNIFNAPADLEFPKGCLEMKSSWKILGPKDDKTKFFWTEADVGVVILSPDGKPTIDPSGKTRRETVALVGLHVVGVVDGHPEFIWSTFEHVDNAPGIDFKALDPKTYRVADPMKPVDTTRDFLFYPMGAKAGDCNKKQPLKFKSEADQTFEPTTPVFRHFKFGAAQNDEDPAVKTLNKNVWDAINKLAPKLSVWKNYKLVGAVWLNNPAYFKEGLDFARRDKQDHDPAMPGSVDRRILGGETKLSNSTMETFTQLTKQNCFFCHQTIDDVQNGQVIFPGKRIGVSHILKNAYVNTHLAQQADLEKRNAELAAALSSNNARDVGRFLADQFQLSGAGESVLDRREYLENIRSGKLKHTSVKIDGTNVQLDDSVGRLTSQATIAGAFQDKDLSGTYEFKDTWVKRGDRWSLTSRQQTLRRGSTVDVIGKSGAPGGNRWEDRSGNKSPATATIGKPDGRLVIRVKNGDVVRFSVDGPVAHAVIFEQAQAEMKAGTWTIVPNSGSLDELPADFKNFDRVNARKTPKKSGNNLTLIEISIQNLKSGDNILFACDPHSTGADPAKQPMLGTIQFAD